MKTVIVSLVLFLVCSAVMAQTPPVQPVYKVQIGIGEDATMKWTDLSPQPTFTITTGIVSEQHNYFGIFGNQTWVFAVDTFRFEFSVKIDAPMKRYRLKIIREINGVNTGESIPSEPVYSYESNVISTLVHLLNK